MHKNNNEIQLRMHDLNLPKKIGKFFHQIIILSKENANSIIGEISLINSEFWNLSMQKLQTIERNAQEMQQKELKA